MVKELSNIVGNSSWEESYVINLTLSSICYIYTEKRRKIKKRKEKGSKEKKKSQTEGGAIRVHSK